MTYMGGGKSRFSPRIWSYCCNILESKTMSGIQHFMAVLHPCIRCTGTAQNIRNRVLSQELSIQETLRAIRCVQGWDSRRGMINSDKGRKIREERVLFVCNRLKELFFCKTVVSGVLCTWAKRNTNGMFWSQICLSEPHTGHPQTDERIPRVLIYDQRLCKQAAV